MTKTKAHNKPVEVGVLSDTHGLFRPQIERAFEGVDHILHAGDVGGLNILDRLTRMAHVTAVKGNTDSTTSKRMPADQWVEIAGCSFYILHDLYDLDLDPVSSGLTAVIHGHTHRDDIRLKDDVFYINPGSAGPLRDQRPPTVARLTLDNGELYHRIVRLDLIRV